MALGKPFYQFSAVKMAHAPPGHHSVIGRPSSEGLSFAEYVVYRGEQVHKHCLHHPFPMANSNSRFIKYCHIINRRWSMGTGCVGPPSPPPYPLNEFFRGIVPLSQFWCPKIPQSLAKIGLRNVSLIISPIVRIAFY